MLPMTLAFDYSQEPPVTIETRVEAVPVYDAEGNVVDIEYIYSEVYRTDFP